MPARRLTLPAACAAIALSGCTPSPRPATLDDINWAAQQPVYLIVKQEDVAERQAEDAANHKVRAALQTRVSADFDQTDLATVAHVLADMTGIDIVVNWPALALSHIGPESPVTLRAADMSAERVLVFALEQASAEAFDDDKAGYQIRDGLVSVSTIADLRKNSEARLYDVRDLVYDNPVLTTSIYSGRTDAMQLARLLQQGDLLSEYPKFDLRWISDAGVIRRSADLYRGGGGGGGPNDGAAQGGLFGSDDEEEEDTRTEAQIQRDLRADQILELIQDSVGDPDEWLDEESTIRIVRGNLFINTTRDNHEAIHALLVGLRQVQAERYQRQLTLIEVFVLLKQAETHRLNQDYDAALEAIDQALRVDPQNPEAVAMREVVVATMRRGE